MNQADILAIRLAVTHVQQAQRALAAVDKQIQGIQKRNQSAMSRGVSWFKQWMAGARDAKSSGMGMITTYARLAGVFATVGAAALGVYKTIQSFETLQAFRQGLEFKIGKDAAGTMERDIRALARMTGTRATSFMPDIQAMLGTEAVTDKETVPILRAFLALGKRQAAMPEQIQRAFTQFTQIASNGKLQGDELRIMQENMVNLRGLLKRAGLGDRIGSQSDPITFDEIKKALLQFGESAEAQKYLTLGSNNATAAFNRLFDIIMLDVLPVFGKMLTPVAIEFAEWLERMVKSTAPQAIEKYGRKMVEFAEFLMKFIESSGPGFLRAIDFIAGKVIWVGEQFMALDKIFGGRLMQTLTTIAAIKLVGGVVGGGIGNAAQTAGGIGNLLRFLKEWGAALVGLISSIFLMIQAAGSFAAFLGTSVATIIGAGSLAVVVALGALAAAIGAFIGWLINMIPGVQNVQRAVGEWISDNLFGGNKDKEEAAKVNPEWLPGGRLRTEWERKQAMKNQQGPAPAESMRRSDPQRLITEGGANGIRYAR